MTDDGESIDSDEIDDFQLEEPIYRVSVSGYKTDDFDGVAQSTVLLETKDPEEAENLAKSVYDDPRTVLDRFDDSVRYLVIEVETLVDLDGAEEDVYNTYHRIVEIVRK